jgi:hypothetical protein
MSNPSVLKPLLSLFKVGGGKKISCLSRYFPFSHNILPIYRKFSKFEKVAIFYSNNITELRELQYITMQVIDRQYLQHWLQVIFSRHFL